MRILLIDDEPILLKDILTLGGYRVDVALDGMEGLEMLGQNPPYDLILLDVRMPRMDGWRTLEIIKAQKMFESVHVIMLTANNMEESIVKGLHAGADEYLIKPISPHRLLAHIYALGRRKGKNPSSSQDKPLKDLTDRENEVIALVGQGLPNGVIAKKLCISETTVKSHLTNIFAKLGLTNRAQIILLMKVSVSETA